MADKAISELTQATEITDSDLFVLQQGDTAKKLPGSTLKNYVVLDVVSTEAQTLPAGSDATANYDKANKTLKIGVPTGLTGSTGPKGATGPANTLKIGTVTSGSEAGATITGAAPNQTLNLVLPKGDNGATGPHGIQGPAGPANVLTIGSVTSGEVASATITGESPNQTLNLVLEKGDKGDTGPTGSQGPQGVQGEQGPQGQIGPQGEQGPAGKDGTTPHIGPNGNWYIGDTDTGVLAGGASHIFKVIVGYGPGGPDTLSANKTFAEIKSAYSSGSMVVVQHGSSLYELTYMGNTKVEFTHVNETYCDVLSCTNSGAPQEADGWLLNQTKRINYDTKYGDIGQKTVPVAIKDLQDKSAPTVTDSDAGKYLHVNASTKELEWADVESGGGSGLPAVTAADAGKFLRVSSSGSWVAETVANANGGEF